MGIPSAVRATRKLNEEIAHANFISTRRIFREPELEPSKVAIKADPLALSRSAIRRNRAVRHPHARDHASSRSHRPASGSDTSALLGRRSRLEIIRSDRRLMQPSVTNSPSESDIELEANNARVEASNRRRLESGRALLLDALSYERPGQRLRQASIDMHNMPPPLPPAPESRDYARPRSEHIEDSSAGFQTERIRTSSPQYMPTPPHTSGDRSSRSPPAISVTPPPLGSAALTPRFAPAYRLEESGAGPARPQSSAGVARSNIVPHYTGGLELDDLPPLRRMGHRRLVDGPLRNSSENNGSRQASAPVDGLGDRQRSFSPDDDAWETLLTTIAPDNHLPSAESSFTSASASASASSLISNSASSSNSFLTAPTSSSDTLEPFPICDLSTESEGSETEAEDFDIMENTDPSGQLIRNPYRYSANIRARGDEAGRMAEEMLDESILRHNRNAEERAERDQEFQQMHAILDRLARREEIPDEWWAAAGLSRDPERLERERL
ncbi:MAG: hypothetical protein M1827_005395 [Pycnora praestabilis]|nr:MAG: hypothetical protein M1827_005395 [Pycnora praestabilis]